MRSVIAAFAFLAAALANLGAADAAGQRILVQSTTSTQNSGLYDHLLPLFEAETGWRVAVIAVGTGQAIRNAAAGDADVLLVHARAAEEAFVEAGHGVQRFDVMYNDFVIVGPESDPLGLSLEAGLEGALKALAAGRAPFVSRGDDSGTHKAERRLWDAAGLDPQAFGAWYRETGSGMGATVRVATQMDAYVLTDRATWLSYGDKGDHRILFEGDPALFNQYGVIAVNPARHAHVNHEGALALIDWLLSDRGQRAIADFKVAGRQLFFPNAEALID